MSLFIIGATFDVIGKVLIGVAVLLVHRKIIKEKRIDLKVVKEMHHERNIVFLGVVSIIIGYLFHVASVL